MRSRATTQGNVIFLIRHKMEKPCSVCAKQTEWRCSDCYIAERKDVAVCESVACRDEHEKGNVNHAAVDIPNGIDYLSIHGKP